MLVTNTGLTTQVLLGASVNVYSNPKACFLNKCALFGGMWNDLCTSQHNPTVGNWNEFDWFAGIQFTIAKNWSFSTQYIAFLSPPGNFKTEQNIEFSLSYDDSAFKLPIVLNPYIKFFLAVAGDSTVVVGKRGGTYDIEIGINPTLKLKQYALTLSLPTWVTVGPAAFWNGGTLGLKDVKNKNCGVFSTGFKGIANLGIPKSYGNWYVDAGIQYYYLINRNLMQAQTVTLQLSSINSAHRSVAVAYLGFGSQF